MYKAIALDDDENRLDMIRRLSEHCQLIQTNKFFTDPVKAIRYVHRYPVEVIFIAVNILDDFSLNLNKQITSETGIIALSDAVNHAARAYDAGAIDFLLMPVSQERFDSAVKRATAFIRLLHQNDNEDNFLFIRADYSKKKIALKEIQYIEALDDYLKIHMENSKPVVAKMTMKSIMELLPEKSFIRSHRSYIVPVNKIRSIRKKYIVLESTTVPIGSRYESIIRDLL